MENGDKSTELIIRDERYALVPSNQNIQKIATRLRWRPETAIVRIKRALPSFLEQQIYLTIAPLRNESALLPESLAKLLRLYLGHQELQLEDVAPGSVGRSRFESFVEFLGDCINLLKVVTKEFDALSLKIEHAGLIVLHYGKDDPERLIEMIDCNLEEMCEVLNISNRMSYAKKMGICISVVVMKIIPVNNRNGTPDLLDLTGFLSMSSVQRHNLRRVFSQEVPDYLSASSDDLRQYDELRLLKTEGIV
jgi:hypothetical protein